MRSTAKFTKGIVEFTPLFISKSKQQYLVNIRFELSPTSFQLQLEGLLSLFNTQYLLTL